MVRNMLELASKVLEPKTANKEFERSCLFRLEFAIFFRARQRPRALSKCSVCSSSATDHRWPSPLLLKGAIFLLRQERKRASAEYPRPRANLYDADHWEVLVLHLIACGSISDHLALSARHNGILWRRGVGAVDIQRPQEGHRLGYLLDCPSYLGPRSPADSTI